ncbi:hypothetical protein CDAR_610941, partial [Caerostris darwini]
GRKHIYIMNVGAHLPKLLINSPQQVKIARTAKPFSPFLSCYLVAMLQKITQYLPSSIAESAAAATTTGRQTGIVKDLEFSSMA